MKSLVRTTPHPQDKPKSPEEKILMVRKQTPEERALFLQDRNKYTKLEPNV
jgi:hypothetical protein